jgi:hypothetical protein
MKDSSKTNPQSANTSNLEVHHSKTTEVDSGRLEMSKNDFDCPTNDEVAKDPTKTSILRVVTTSCSKSVEE